MDLSVFARPGAMAIGVSLVICHGATGPVCRGDAGGGFLIVPALVFMGGLSIHVNSGRHLDYS